MHQFGFVYLWRDRLKNMYCVGSHLGPEDDGYVTSTGWMSKAYAKRPEDFKRRIIYRLYEPNLKLLHTVEQRWLDMIKEPELCVRYYNIKRIARGGNGRANLGRRGHRHSATTKAKMSAAQTGRTQSPEAREKISRAQLGSKKPLKSEEVKARISAALRGKPKSLETRMKMRAAHLGKPKPRKVAL